MRIAVHSDLHVEFHADQGLTLAGEIASAEADVLVLAGDICVVRQLAPVLEMFCERSPAVVYLPGNHEFYGSGFADVRAELERVSRSLDNLHVLDNTSVELCGVRFVGTTLWFPDGADNERYASGMTDFEVITAFRQHVYDENRRAVDFLRLSVRKADVVVTHHLPSHRSVAARYATHPLTRFFVSPLDDLILEREPALWVHGHTHDSFDYHLGPTRVLCNPFGYARYELNPSYRSDLVVEVSSAGR